MACQVVNQRRRNDSEGPLRATGPMAIMAPMRPTLVSFGLVFALLLAGCGGSSNKSQTKTTSSKTKTTHKSTKPGPVAKKAAPLSELITVAKSHKAASASASAATGDSVLFLTRVPGTSTSSPVNVHIDLSRKADTKWTVTASVKGQKSTATLTSKNGKLLTLEKIRYSCALPPSATFCPVSHVHSSATHVGAQFSATPATPISLTASVGPLPVPAVAALPTSSVAAPTYTVLTKVLAVSAHPSKSAPPARPAPSVSVHPGEGLTVRIGVTGKVVGAPQTVTVSFAQGPSKSLTVSAGVPGGTPSTATITSTTGRRIEIVLPRYSCLLPPAPTFCPLSKVVAAAHKYTIVYNATPKTPALVISTAVQGG